MLDKIGLRAQSRFYAEVPNGATLVELTDGIGALAALVNAVTASTIVGGRVLVEVDVSGLTPNDDSTSRNFEQAALNFNNVDNTRSGGVLVPGVRDSLIVNGKVVDGSGAVKDLADYLVAAWAFAGSEGNGHFTDAEWHHFATLRDTFLSNRSRTKAVSSRTKSNH